MMQSGEMVETDVTPGVRISTSTSRDLAEDRLNCSYNSCELYARFARALLKKFNEFKHKAFTQLDTHVLYLLGLRSPRLSLPLVTERTLPGHPIDSSTRIIRGNVYQ